MPSTPDTDPQTTIDTGNAELDAAVAAFMAATPDLDSYRDKRNAWGACEHVAEQLTAFLRDRGYKAYTCSDEIAAFGYTGRKCSKAIGAGDFSYPEHAVTEVYDVEGVGNVCIDFTAAQYGFSEFPKISF